MPTGATTIAATATSAPFAPFAPLAVLKLIGFVLLMLGLVGLHARQSAAAGTLGKVGVLTAFTGTALVCGDWWFEAFAVPWLAQVAPDLLTAPASGPLLAGGVLSLTGFTIGWLVFAAASFRARVFPR